MTKLSDLTLEQIFAERLTDTPCVYLNKKREVWVATEMCVQYLESTIDSIVVRDDNLKPIGIVGGYDLLDSIRKNPTRDFQYKTTVPIKESLANTSLERAKLFVYEMEKVIEKG